MDTFFALPTSTTFSPFTPLSPASKVVIEDIVTPLIPVRTPFNSYLNPLLDPLLNPLAKPLIIPKVVTGLGVTSLYGPTNAFYYDSGIGENSLAQYETNEDLRYKFLDKWLYDKEGAELLRMLKVDGNSVRVVSKSEAEKNDISKDSESDLEKKSDFIAYEILSLLKNKKILDALCMKNNLKYYDLPHNEYFVKRAQIKYVKKKLEELQK
jgi:hypothetical protein